MLIGKTHPAQCGHGPLAPLLRADAGVQQRQLHVFQHRQLGNQVILLKNKPQHFVAYFRLLVVIHGGHINAPQVVGSRRGNVQAADNVHGRGLAGTGGAYDGHELPLIHRQVDAVQGVDGLLSHVVDLVDVFQFNEMAHGISLPSSCPSNWKPGCDEDDIALLQTVGDLDVVVVVPTQGDLLRLQLGDVHHARSRPHSGRRDRAP